MKSSKTAVSISGSSSKLILSLILILSIPSTAQSADSPQTAFNPYAASDAQGNYLKPPLVMHSPGEPAETTAPIVTETNVSIPKQQIANVSAPTDKITLGTQTGFNIGLQSSYYRYQEHAHEHPEFMHEIGPQVGLTGTATKTFNSGLFLAADGRIAYGNNHYSSSGSGTQNGMDDYFGEIRGLVGQDFLFAQSRADFSPYSGIGYRDLFNDMRGTSSLGDRGYRRYSQYLYLPLGFTQRFRATEQTRLSTNLEYDQLLRGWQTSYLGDAGSPRGTVEQQQHHGYGLRGSIMYEYASWGIGPFFDYWNINQSELGRFGGFEPHDQTTEYGLQGQYHF